VELRYGFPVCQEHRMSISRRWCRNHAASLAALSDAKNRCCIWLVFSSTTSWGLQLTRCVGARLSKTLEMYPHRDREGTTTSFVVVAVLIWLLFLRRLLCMGHHSCPAVHDTARHAGPPVVYIIRKDTPSITSIGRDKRCC
jgi:hypothetical protein